MYTFKNRCIEDEKVSNDDKSTKVIYNATSYAKEKDSQIRAFLQYLCNRSSTDDFTNKIDQRVENFKLSERFKGDYMFVKLHEWEMKEKAKKEGYEEGFESGPLSINLFLSLIKYSDILGVVEVAILEFLNTAKPSDVTNPNASAPRAALIRKISFSSFNPSSAFAVRTSKDLYPNVLTNNLAFSINSSSIATSYSEIDGQVGIVLFMTSVLFASFAN